MIIENLAYAAIIVLMAAALIVIPAQAAAVMKKPHTITFVLANKTMTGVVSPMIVPNSTQFTTLILIISQL